MHQRHMVYAMLLVPYELQMSGSSRHGREEEHGDSSRIAPKRGPLFAADAAPLHTPVFRPCLHPGKGCSLMMHESSEIDTKFCFEPPDGRLSLAIVSQRPDSDHVQQNVGVLLWNSCMNGRRLVGPTRCVLLW